MNANESGSKALLTVILLTYDHAEFVEQCLDSIVEQKCTFPFRVHVFDDVSNDNTREIVNRYQERFPNIIFPFFSEKNIGAISNFKRSLNSVKTKYTATLEGDDFWCDANKLQEQVDLLESNPNVAGVSHDVEILNEQGERSLWRTYDRNEFNQRDTISQRSLFHTSSFVYRTVAMETPEWFTDIVSGDMAMFAIVAQHGSLMRIPGVKSVYRKHAGGITTGEALSRYHQHRIRLWKYFSTYLTGDAAGQARNLMLEHQAELKKLTPSFAQKVKFKLNKWFS